MNSCINTLDNELKRILITCISQVIKKPIPVDAFEGIWRALFEPEAKGVVVAMMPYGGRMGEISESSIPFPHMSGNLYMLAHFTFWVETETRNSDRYINWSRRFYNYLTPYVSKSPRFYNYLTPYVSKSPRAAYLNYRDLDLGVNNVRGKTSYAEASIWGLKYFKNNFDRLVRVKTSVDPKNFFRNEQSIPPLN